jgi:hypothetical protein
MSEQATGLFCFPSALHKQQACDHIAALIGGLNRHSHNDWRRRIRAFEQLDLG